MDAQDSVSSEKQRGGRSAIAGLALLLAVAGVAGVVFLWQRIESNRIDVDSRLKTLSERSLAAVAERATETSTWQLIDERQRRLETANTGMSTAIRQLGSTVEGFAKTGRDDWILAEAEHLLRIGNHSLLVTRDAGGALVALQTADALLRDLNDPGLVAVRSGLATASTRLREFKAVDSEGIYLRLSAIESRLPALMQAKPDFHAAAANAAGASDAAAQPSWWQRILRLLDRYIVISHRGENSRLPLSLGEEQRVRERLSLLLTQAQFAVVTREPAIYTAALRQAAGELAAHFDPDAPVNRAMRDELQALQQQNLRPELPDISAVQKLLHELIEQRTHPAMPIAAPATAPSPAPSLSPAPVTSDAPAVVPGT